MKTLRRGIGSAVGVFALCLGFAAAQERLGQGKSPAQLFASDCAICHKSPQGLAAKAGGLFGLDGFLREHYTSSRETAAAIANYLKSVDSGPATPARAGKRTAKSKADEKKKPEAKPGEAKTEKKPEAGAPGSSEPKSSGTKLSEPASSEPKSVPKPVEAKASEPKPGAPKAGASPGVDAKPAEGPKPEKPE